MLTPLIYIKPLPRERSRLPKVLFAQPVSNRRARRNAPIELPQIRREEAPCFGMLSLVSRQSFLLP
jgi:hypothetical protein